MIQKIHYQLLTNAYLARLKAYLQKDYDAKLVPLIQKLEKMQSVLYDNYINFNKNRFEMDLQQIKSRMQMLN